MKKYLVFFALIIFLSTPLAGTAEQTAASQSAPPAAVSTFAQDDTLFVVNKEVRLTSEYIPQDLVTPRVPTRKKSLQDSIQLRGDAAMQLEAMFLAADIEAGHTLYAVSGYRSYGIQQINFNNKVDESGSRDRAMRTVAPAGASEHQLGLAMDIQSKNFLNLNQGFGETQEGIWLMENSPRFGFILRYKKEWSDITGFSYEPWHFRYVGVAHAKAIHALDIPLETYTAYLAALPAYAIEGGSDVLLAGLVKDLMAGNQQQLGILMSKTGGEEGALRGATKKYLPDNTTYEQALWAVYPTPRPTSAPRVDDDEEVSLFQIGG